MAIEVIVHPGVDSALVAWRSPFIADCRGFLSRQRKGWWEFSARMFQRNLCS